MIALRACRGLMAPEEFKKLGFSEKDTVAPTEHVFNPPDRSKELQGFVAGLTVKMDRK